MVPRLGLSSGKHMPANIERHHRDLYTQAQMHSATTAGSTHSIVSGIDTDPTT